MSSSMARRGLGRGLASLIPDSAFESAPRPGPPSGLRIVPIDQIRPNPNQPREYFDKTALAVLAESIRQHGILTPLVARKHEGQYVLIAGERRLRAAALAGLDAVPVMLREAEDDLEQLELALVENLQRSDLDAIEAARGYKRLIEEFGHTQDQVAKAVGRDRSTIANTVRLLKAPDFVQEALRGGRITAGHARALLSLERRLDQQSALAKIVANDLSVRATERLVGGLSRQVDGDEGTGPRNRRTMAYAEGLLARSLRAQVAITHRKRGGGRIMIDYADAEELERLIDLLRER